MERGKLVLRGTLETFPLADVLRLLTLTNQSGRLKLQALGGTGSVWMGEGSIVAASSSRLGDVPADEALADLLRWGAGKFAFTAQEPSRSTAGMHDTEQLLGDAQLLVDEWDDLLALVPSLEHGIALVSALPNHAVKIDAVGWSWLIAIGGGCTVRELAAALDLTELGVLRVVRTLLGLGVATVSPPSAPDLLMTPWRPSVRSGPVHSGPDRGSQRILG
jgi:uncharacterized protein DUF4388